MDLKSILTTVQFICRFDEANFDNLKPTIYHNIDKFTFEQVRNSFFFLLLLHLKNNNKSKFIYFLLLKS